MQHDVKTADGSNFFSLDKRCTTDERSELDKVTATALEGDLSIISCFKLVMRKVWWLLYIIRIAPSFTLSLSQNSKYSSLWTFCTVPNVRTLKLHRSGLFQNDSGASSSVRCTEHPESGPPIQLLYNFLTYHPNKPKGSLFSLPAG